MSRNTPPKDAMSSRFLLGAKRRFVMPNMAFSLTILVLIGLGLTSSNIAQASTITSSSTSVNSGVKVDLTSQLDPTNQTGTLTQEITQILPAGVTLTAASDVKVPAGWTASYNTASISNWSFAPTTLADWASVTQVRAVGNLVSAGMDAQGYQLTGRDVNVSASSGAFVANPITGSAGTLDGWDVFFQPGTNHVFNVAHQGGPSRTSGLVIDCHNRDGSSCGPGWPYVRSGKMTSMNSQGVVIGDKIWAPTTNGDGTGFGFSCVDISNFSTGPVDCPTSYTQVSSRGYNYNLAPLTNGIIGYCSSVASHVKLGCDSSFAVVGTKIYTVGALSGYIYWMDTATGVTGNSSASPFSGVTMAGTRLVSGKKYYSITLREWGGKLYATLPTQSQSDDIFTTGVVCWDPATNAVCSGWTTTPRAAGSLSGMLYVQPASGGNPEALCVTNKNSDLTSSTGTGTVALHVSCFTGSSTTVAVNTALNNAISLDNGANAYAGLDFKSPVTFGTKVFWSDAAGTATAVARGGAKTFCWETTTNTLCANWPVIATDNYSATIDPINPNCLWTNSDAVGIKPYSVDTGQLGCAQGAPSISIPVATVQAPDVTCDVSGVSAWSAVKISNNANLSYSSASLKVIKTDGTTIATVPITNGIADLSGSGSASQAASFLVEFTNRTDTEATAVSVLSKITTPSLCTSPKVVFVCPSGPGIYSAVAHALVVTSTGLVGTQAQNLGSVTVNVNPLSASTCSTSLSGTALDSSGNPVAGVTVSLKSGSTVVATAVTNSSGFYQFASLLPASYTATFPNSSPTLTVISATAADTNPGTNNAVQSASGGLATSGNSTLAIGTPGVINALYTSVSPSSVSAVDDSYTTPYETVLTSGDATTADVFPAGSTFAQLSSPAHGTVSFRSDGTFTYVPASGFTGTDTFTYSVTDPGTGDSDIATESITVLGTVVNPAAQIITGLLANTGISSSSAGGIGLAAAISVLAVTAGIFIRRRSR